LKQEIGSKIITELLFLIIYVLVIVLPNHLLFDHFVLCL
jgi:hypothetical protein